MRASSFELLPLAASAGAWWRNVPGLCCLDALHGHGDDLVEHVAQPLGVGNQRFWECGRAHAIDPDHAFVGFFLDDLQLGHEFSRRARALGGAIVSLDRGATR